MLEKTYLSPLLTRPLFMLDKGLATEARARGAAVKSVVSLIFGKKILAKEL